MTKEQKAHKAYIQKKKDLEDLKTIASTVYITKEQRRHLSVIVKRIYTYVDTYTTATADEKAAVLKWLNGFKTAEGLPVYIPEH